jgi:glycosyltransferase involved in cell wall biosynthesis
MEKGIPSAEIVVGICTKNCEKTIENVIRVVDDGLSEFYPRRRSLIVVSDLSDDSTRDVVKRTPTKKHLCFTGQFGGPGKGNGIRTVFMIAEKAGASIVVLVDGDLTSISKEWVKSLVEPIIEGFDLAVPYYQRYKYDSVITNHLIYPFVASMYGADIRQPIGGDFGLSMDLVKKLMGHPMFPGGYDIDIFITITALAEGMKVSETVLGVKSHASTETYKEFDKSLVPMFRQVVGTMFRLTDYNMDRIRRVREVKSVRRFGQARKGFVKASSVDRKALFGMFYRDFRKLMFSDVLSEETKNEINRVMAGSEGKRISASVWISSISDLFSYYRGMLNGKGGKVMRSDIFSEKTKERLRESIYGEKGQIISVDTWVNAVFDAFRKSRNPDRREEAINVLVAVWMARFSSFVRQTRFMDTGDAECMIRGQVNVFSEKRERFMQSLVL